MKLLADENIHAAIVARLRGDGHDVLWAAESHPRAHDPDLLALAKSESRVVLTEDLDFGELVYRQRLPAYGVVLLRLGARPIGERLRILHAWWPAIQSRAAGHFIVLSPKRMRARRLP